MKLLTKTIVNRFYRQNAGQLIFVFTIFFGAVGELSGVKVDTGPFYQLHYQYQLICGLLTDPGMMIAVLIAWLCYVEKCTQFALSAIQQKDHAFMYSLNLFPGANLFKRLYRIQLLLLLPLLLYSIAIIAVAIHKHWYINGISLVAYLFLLAAMATGRCYYQLHHPGWTPRRPLAFIGGIRPARPPYWTIFIQYTFKQQRLLVAGIKLFSCGMIFFTCRALTVVDYDARMTSMLFGLVIFGHSVLIYRWRELEEQKLIFYRGLPVPMSARLIQYAILYAVLLIPEVITFATVSPAYLHPTDAMELLATGYALLLLQSALLFVSPIPIREYLKITLVLFGVLYFAVMGKWLPYLALIATIAAVSAITFNYYKYESQP